MKSPRSNRLQSATSELYKIFPSRSPMNYVCMHMFNVISLEDHLISPWLMGYPSCFHFIPRGTAPSFPIWKNFTFLSLKTWLHMAPPFLFHYGSIHTRWSSSRGARHLPREAGALDCLWPFFYLVLITASVECHHFASACFNMVSFMMVCTGYNFPPQGYNKYYY